MPNPFLEAIDEYLDQNNLLGPKPFPRINSSGNPLTLAGVAGIVLHDRNESNGTLTRIDYGVSSLELGNGIPDKKHDSLDEVTHDDLLGMVCWSKMIGKDYHERLYKVGKEKRWMLSNTGSYYFTAQAKPWDKAVYELSATGKSAFWLALLIKLFIDAITPWKSPSGDQLNLMRLYAIKDLSWSGKWLRFYKFSIKLKYGSVSKMFAMYHGEEHPFAKYYP